MLGIWRKRSHPAHRRRPEKKKVYVMKATVDEFDECFSIELTAETINEAASLTRMGMNATKELTYFCTDVFKDGSFISTIELGKNKRAETIIIKRK
jgi:hypothetical protein